MCVKFYQICFNSFYSKISWNLARTCEFNCNSRFNIHHFWTKSLSLSFVNRLVLSIYLMPWYQLSLLTSSYKTCPKNVCIWVMIINEAWWDINLNSKFWIFNMTSSKTFFSTQNVKTSNYWFWQQQVPAQVTFIIYAFTLLLP